MSKKVFVVVEGEYSDYHIEALFSEREDAERMVQLHNPKGYESGYRIEEYPLDDPLAMRTDGLTRYSVRIHRDGNGAKVTPHWNAPEDILWVGGRHFHFTDGQWLHVTVEAKDEKHAIKIANEKRGQVLAAGQWDTLKNEGWL